MFRSTSIYVALLLSFTMPCSVGGEATIVPDNKNTIRGTYWGMTAKEVKALEKWRLLGSDGTMLRYTGELKPGVKTKLAYRFQDGLLVSIVYMFDKDKTLYRNFLTILTEKYGTGYEQRTREHALLQFLRLSKSSNITISKEARSLRDFFYCKWEIHERTTHLQIVHTAESELMAIIYKHMGFKKAQDQLEKDKERDADYSLTNSDDL